MNVDPGHKIAQVFKALMHRHTITVKGQQYKYLKEGEVAYTKSENNTFGEPMEIDMAASINGIFMQTVSEKNGVESEIWIGFSNNIDTIFKLAEEMTDQEYIAMCSGITLTEMDIAKYSLPVKEHSVELHNG